MKKLLIAGYEAQTVNYRNACSALGIQADFLCSYPEQPDPGPAGRALPAPCRLACLYDGLVLPGGGDIAPSLFHGTNQGSREIDEALDRLQLSLLRAFVRADRPVLGICKGLQIINVGFGGTIIQDLGPASLAIHAWEEQDRVHTTKAARDTFIHRLYGPHPVVNSAHHQAAGIIGRGLRVAQYAEDFVVEALYHESLPVLGVQWHPERMCFSLEREDTEDGALLLLYFISML